MGHSKKRKITSLVHRQVRIDERSTSLALEAEFWHPSRGRNCAGNNEVDSHNFIGATAKNGGALEFSFSAPI
jgi:hypothetical protein